MSSFLTKVLAKKQPWFINNPHGQQLLVLSAPFLAVPSDFHPNSSSPHTWVSWLAPLIPAFLCAYWVSALTGYGFDLALQAGTQFTAEQVSQIHSTALLQRCWAIGLMITFVCVIALYRWVINAMACTVLRIQRPAFKFYLVHTSGWASWWALTDWICVRAIKFGSGGYSAMTRFQFQHPFVVFFVMSVVLAFIAGIWINAFAGLLDVYKRRLTAIILLIFSPFIFFCFANSLISFLSRYLPKI